MDTPEVRRRRVFMRGRVKGLRGTMFAGGQMPPMAMEGLREAEKKAQKKPKKSMISEPMKSTMPVRRSRLTERVCRPRYSLSRARVRIQPKKQSRREPRARKRRSEDRAEVPRSNTVSAAMIAR
jgi:hypothetical protein